MTCDCEAPDQSEASRSAVRVALALNAGMFAIGVVAAVLADSAGILADALDMLTDSVGYLLALAAFSRGARFKANAARWTGSLLLVLGAGVVAEVLRRALYGSDPVGSIMIAYSMASFAVNLYVLIRLARVKEGAGVHLRASYICTRADVIANFAVFISGIAIMLTGLHFVDLVAGFGIGIYVAREALEIFREANESLREA